MRSMRICLLFPLALAGAVSMSCSSGEPPTERTQAPKAQPTPARAPDDAVAAASSPHDRPAPPAAGAGAETTPRSSARPGAQTPAATRPTTQTIRSTPQKPQEEVSDPKSLVRPEKP